MYRDTIPHELAVRLKEEGMTIKRVINPETAVSYARVIDWFAEQGVDIHLRHIRPEDFWAYGVVSDVGWGDGTEKTFTKAADSAIKAAIQTLRFMRRPNAAPQQKTAIKG